MNTEDAIQAAVDRIVSGYNLALKKAVSSARAKAHRAGMLAGLEEAAKVCDDADKSMHPADLADAIRARIAEIEGEANDASSPNP